MNTPIITLLKNLFLPTEENHMRPWLASTQAFVCFALMSIALLFSPFYFRVSHYALVSQIPLPYRGIDLIALINQERIQARIPVLMENELLNRAAAEKASDMFRNQYFAHTSPDNKDPWDFILEYQYNFVAAGENLAIDFTDAYAAHNAFMRSPSHRTNIMSRTYQDLGITVTQGEIDGRQRIVVVMLFARRAPVHAGTPSDGGQHTTLGLLRQDSTSVKSGSLTSLEKPQIKPLVLAESTRETPVESALPDAILQSSNPNTPLDTRVRIAALGAIGGVTIPIVFLLIRVGRITPAVAGRSLALLLLFGYLAIFSVRATTTARIDTYPAAVIIVPYIKIP